MQVKFSKKSPLFWLYVAGGVLLLVAVWLWYSVISINPERVFWATIDHSLTSRGVTVKAERSANGTSAKQTISYSLGAENRSHSLTTLSQGGTTIQNEMIGTPTADYSRYASIQTDQKRADGGAIDTSKLVGVWAKSDAGTSNLFPQAVFGGSLPIGGMGVPMGNMPPDVRGRLVQQIKDTDAYNIDFKKTKKERAHGRLLYTYQASIRPAAYAAIMKQFAQNIGLHGLDQLDPQSYKDQKAFRLDIVIDARAHNVVRIAAPDSDNVQTYSGHDLPVQADLPKQTITAAQLQKLLSDLQ